MNIKHLNFEKFLAIWRKHYPHRIVIVPLSDGQIHRHFYVSYGVCNHVYSTFDYRECRILNGDKSHKSKSLSPFKMRNSR